MKTLARVFLAELRYYGIDNHFSDIVSDDPGLVCFAAKIGLTIIQSASSPAESYLLEHVNFPRFVRRYGFERYIPVSDDIFRESVRFLLLHFPQFYYNCIVWPVSIR